MASNAQYACEISVVTEYLSAQSSPEAGQYVYAYTITIRNTGSVQAQLISRHWVITDAMQQVREVKGLGVVGDQPLIAPEDEYSYTSSVMFSTPSGEMFGTFQMVAVDGHWFEVDVPTFWLHQAAGLH
ncbi:Co2+/Mg2+ efflux protein ApaG [Methylophilus medardicus]|uniref:Protein ApaG n=1 Tax=Methylophilus medardicus TaxID=2588534 RepID=A0A5B8CUV4_9PROT|nr:Co2+/Mg2+ efflux protein ApaG [Methylophilus medardicus]QDC45091.1 Co2+/Mg2+ efflux protein ApaG [Methylophilus medardicus]QDC50098.1 Co2+/Mg2+ efflux protein ApaG [Methylophilus medardicus]QDC53803.1 Co2+/Mg2+ efflux protein ApaG [Methylophilus medardicus]